MKPRELIRLLERDGWYLVRTKGSHQIFAHNAKKGLIVVAFHGGVDIPGGLLRSILKQAGLEED
jgi:predicted RNA binding protein YcfA (HicA-like mRNA interferase family)